MLRDHPLSFEDVQVGDEWISPARTVTEADVVAFAGLSGDYNALHVDHEAARAGPFRQPVAHGLLGLALVSGLTMYSPRMATLAFLSIERWDFVKPIAFGDTVHVVTRVAAIIPKARGRRAEVVWSRRLVNQRGETVQEGTTRTLVRSRGDDPPAEPTPGAAPAPQPQD